MIDLGYDDESTPLVVAIIAPRTEEDTAERKPTTNTAVKFVAAMVGMLAIGSFVGVIGGNDVRSSTVALVNGNWDHVVGDVKECPKECQYSGKEIDWICPGDVWCKSKEQAWEHATNIWPAWEEASGRKCCSDAGQDICHLNSPGNTCTCEDVAAIADANGDVELAKKLREPCYIDTRCTPFQTVQGGGCKGKPGTVCKAPTIPTYVTVDCTDGYRCGVKYGDWSRCDKSLPCMDVSF